MQFRQHWLWVFGIEAATRFTGLDGVYTLTDEAVAYGQPGPPTTATASLQKGAVRGVWRQRNGDTSGNGTLQFVVNDETGPEGAWGVIFSPPRGSPQFNETKQLIAVNELRTGFATFQNGYSNEDG